MFTFEIFIKKIYGVSHVTDLKFRISKTDLPPDLPRHGRLLYVISNCPTFASSFPYLTPSRLFKSIKIRES